MITTGSALSLLRPGLNDLWGLGYKRNPEYFSQIFEMLTSNMNYERDVNIYGLQAAAVRPETTATQLDDMAEGFKYDYVHVDYSTGFKVSHQQIRDNLYMQFGAKQGQEMGDAHRETREIVCSRLFNSAFTSALTYADGQNLCSRSHLYSAGGTYSNMPDVDADLSELAIEQAVSQIMRYTDDRGKLHQVNPLRILVPTQEWANVARLLKSQLRTGTPNNDINVLNAEGIFSKGHMVYKFLDDPDAWFIQTDCGDGFKYFQREGLTIKSYVEDPTDCIIVQSREAFSAGCTNTMAIWGSPGA